MNRNRYGFVLSCGLLAVGMTVRANNMSVTNITLVDSGVGYTHVACDVSWDNSWRASWQEGSSTVTNWDAAWVFIKFRVATNNAPWQHATLSTNKSDHIIPAQAVFNVGTSSNAVSAKLGVGGFLYRKDEDSGNWTNRIKLCWNYVQDGVASTSQVVVSVHAIEMVYVPQGSFYVGDGTTTTITGQFCSNTTQTVPFQITSDAEITLGGGTDGCLGNNNVSGMVTKDDFSNTVSRTLPAAFPKGYNAFYCMKYEISQGQWISFFNMLSDSGNQKKSGDLTAGRDITGGSKGTTGKGTDNEVDRNTIAWAGIGSAATCTNASGVSCADRACNYLSSADGCAYADWAGLRPMTELEFEKACRGPLYPVANEYAWGSTFKQALTNFAGIDGSGTEIALPTNANYAGGAVRCGIFATASSTRVTAGATYWGIMEMSGNIFERAVGVGSGSLRSFTGVHGDGLLDANGNADCGWPTAGMRGGTYVYDPTGYRTSDRGRTSQVYTWRTNINGFRCVRSAPAGE